MNLAVLFAEQNSGWSAQVLIALLTVAISTAIVVKWVKLPYSIALVIAGLFIGLFHLLPPVEMTPELVLVILLPALLFEASWNMRFADFRATWWPIALLATAGVIVSTFVVAGIMHWLTGLSFGAALLFGAMISATDPISVLALFKKLGVDKRLTTIVEGESLFNDGTAVVVFKLILGSVMAGTAFSLGQAATTFTFTVVGGTLLGLSVGLCASLFTKLFDDHLVEVTLTAIVAYGSYLVAEAVHVSPVLATIFAGLVMGNYGSRIGMSDQTRKAVDLFWEYAAFIGNSLVFLLIGLQIKLNVLLDHWLLIAAGVTSVLIARAVVVYVSGPLITTRSNPVPAKWRHLLVWGALRGSLCMALALSLPAAFEHKESIVVTTFGVVLFTLLVQGLTISPLVAWLKVERDSKTDK